MWDPEENGQAFCECEQDGASYGYHWNPGSRHCEPPSDEDADRFQCERFFHWIEDFHQCVEGLTAGGCVVDISADAEEAESNCQRLHYRVKGTAGDTNEPWLNVRKAPKGPVVARIADGGLVFRLGLYDEGKWIHVGLGTDAVDPDGKDIAKLQGWVHSAFLEPVSGSASSDSSSAGKPDQTPPAAAD